MTIKWTFYVLDRVKSNLSIKTKLYPAGAFSIFLCFVIVIPKSAVVFLILFFAIQLIKNMRNSCALKLNTSSTLFLLIGFGAWLAITGFWSFDYLALQQSILKVVLLILAGCTLFFAKMGSPNLIKLDGSSWLEASGVIGFGVIVLAFLYASVTGQSLWGSYYFDPLTTLNNNAVVLSLMFWPFILVLPKKMLFYLFSGICIFSLLLALKSLAAIGALVVGISVIAGRKIGGRRLGVLMAVIAALLVIAAPSLIKISGADSFATPSGINNESLGITSSARHRLAMWSFATEKIDEKPWLGWGFGASRHIPQEDRRLAPNMEIMPLHPHNLALQTRLELGLPGSLILAGLVFSVFYRLATFTNDGWVSGLAMAPAAGWLFVANVSYGMWQSWWIALAFLLAIFMKFALASRQRSVESPDTDL